MGMEHLLPERIFKKGPKPGMTSDNAMSHDREYVDNWAQKIQVRSLSEEDKAKVMGCYLEVAVVVIFTKHCYKY